MKSLGKHEAASSKALQPDEMAVSVDAVDLLEIARRGKAEGGGEYEILIDEVERFNVPGPALREEDISVRFELKEARVFATHGFCETGESAKSWR
jgi:hypothetical protein